MEIYTRRLSGVLTVPARALVSYYGRPAVWVVQERAGALVAAPRVVKTGARGGGRVEIVSGLAPGERVIWAGQERLTEGTPVVPGRFGEGPYQDLLLPEPPPGASTPGHQHGESP
jgi:multidrug efflux pump subunit AcrA (membrane-fusion protein)